MNSKALASVAFVCALLTCFDSYAAMPNKDTVSPALNPTPINASDPAKAGLLEMVLLRQHYKPTHTLWQVISKTTVLRLGKRIESVEIETKRPEGNYTVTQKERIEFDITTVKLRGSTTPYPSTPIVNFSGSLPYQLGWLHFDSTINHEPENPGLGESFLYGAPGTKATVYFYDHGLKREGKKPNDEIVSKEFSLAEKDLFTAHPDAKAIEDTTTKYGFRYRSYLVGQNRTYLGLRAFQDGFVKFRATIVNDPLLVQTLGQSLEALSSQLP